MTIFESLFVVLQVAIVLLQASRRIGVPYPATFAAAGALLAIVIGALITTIGPATALAFFIAPALLDAAFELPIQAAQKLWRPFVMLVPL